MKPNLNEIKEYLEEKLNLSNIQVIDDSHQHLHHRSFQAQKAYLTIVLPKKPQNRLQFQREAMKLLSHICNQPLHAVHFQTISSDSTT